MVIRDKLKELVAALRDGVGEIHGRVFTDSAPVLERAWAARSGLGWIGKNGNLINPKVGSYFFIAELITDLDLEPDTPMQDYCGTCTRCIDACPTDAIIKPKVVDGSKCISYFTIELKDAIPVTYKGQFENWAFGCDICQEVCPWNRFSKPATETTFAPKPEITGWTHDDWYEITEEVFGHVFHDSPLLRPGFDGLKRNLEFISENNQAIRGA
jgi:epoxyqueuosine reductase